MALTNYYVTFHTPAHGVMHYYIDAGSIMVAISEAALLLRKQFGHLVDVTIIEAYREKDD